MKEIINKFLLAEGKFMPEMHLRLPGFTYSDCGPFSKNKERIQKFKETGDLRYIHRHELDKVCFQNNMAYRDFKELHRRTTFHKILRDKAFNIAKNPKYDGCERDLASMVFDKISAARCVWSETFTQEFTQEQEFALIQNLRTNVLRT